MESDKSALLNDIAHALAQLFDAADIPLAQATAALTAGYEAAMMQRLQGRGEAPDSLSHITASPALVDAATFLLGRWVSQPSTTDERGEPIPLPRDGPGKSIAKVWDALRSENASFRNEVSLDAVLELLIGNDALIRERAPDGEVFLPQYRHVRFSDDRVNKALHLMTYLRDFAITSSRNLSAGHGEHFQRAAHCLRFPLSEIPILRSRMEEEGMGFLQSIDTYLDLEAQDAGSEEASVRVAIGTYMHYRENEE